MIKISDSEVGGNGGDEGVVCKVVVVEGWGKLVGILECVFVLNFLRLEVEALRIHAVGSMA